MLQGLLGVASTIDRFGPSVVAREFTSSARTKARITWDRDTKHLDASTTAIPQFYVSTDNKVTWTACPATKTGLRTHEFDHPTGGNWIGQTVHFAYCEDSPFGTGDDTGATALLAKLVYDATDDGTGREMVAVPSQGLIADAGLSATVLDLVVTVQGGNTITRQLVINPA